MEFLLAGHSHSFACGVKALGDIRVEPIESSQLPILGLMGGWKGSRTTEYWDALKENAKDKHVVLFWAGNQHNLGFMFKEEETFDFYLKRYGQTETKNVAFVPKAVVQEHFSSSFSRVKKILSELQTCDCLSITVVETPPPKGDNDFLLKFIKQSDHFLKLAEKAGINLEKLDVSSPLFRLKLWKVCQDLLKDICNEMNIRFVEVPEEMKAADGTLDKKYWASDITHANSEYGKAIVQYVYDKVLEE